MHTHKLIPPQLAEEPQPSLAPGLGGPCRQCRAAFFPDGGSRSKTPPKPHCWVGWRLRPPPTVAAAVLRFLMMGETRQSPNGTAGLAGLERLSLNFF